MIHRGSLAEEKLNFFFELKIGLKTKVTANSFGTLKSDLMMVLNFQAIFCMHVDSENQS